jgi:hypothetical protein
MSETTRGEKSEVLQVELLGIWHENLKGSRSYMLFHTHNKGDTRYERSHGQTGARGFLITSAVGVHYILHQGSPSRTLKKKKRFNVLLSWLERNLAIRSITVRQPVELLMVRKACL